jgi:hypothetical protein
VLARTRRQLSNIRHLRGLRQKKKVDTLDAFAHAQCAPCRVHSNSIVIGILVNSRADLCTLLVYAIVATRPPSIVGVLDTFASCVTHTPCQWYGDDAAQSIAYGALVSIRRRRHFTQMLSGVDGLYTFLPSLCNQSVRVIRILVNSHVDLCSLSSTRVHRRRDRRGRRRGCRDGVVVDGAGHRHRRRDDIVTDGAVVCRGRRSSPSWAA